MLTFDIRDNGAEVMLRLHNFRKDKLPEAFQRAANRTGRELVLALQRNMDVVFDRPTPWAKAGVKQQFATKARPLTRVWLEESPGKGTPAARFLAAEIQGGQRKRKRFELALIQAGFMPPSMYAVPGQWAQIDSNGNVPGSFIVKMLADIRAFSSDSSFAMRNRKGKRTGARKTNYFFVPRKGSKLKPGVYRHLPNGLLGVAFIFVSRATYQKRYDFYGVARRAYAENATRILAEEIQRGSI